MKIHKEGYTILRNQILILITINFLVFYYCSDLYFYLLITLSILLFGFSIYFFRIPNREYQKKQNVIYAPADGKIVIIKDVQENEYYKNLRQQISIFMSPLNVHINRYPTHGTIKYTKYHPGKYLVAWHPKSSLKNERNTIVVENEKISILFRQIAGLVARRIVGYAIKESNVEACEECGFIKFGSRVDIFLPKDIDLNVNLNDKVKGGKTILAYY